MTSRAETDAYAALPRKSSSRDSRDARESCEDDPPPLCAAAARATSCCVAVVLVILGAGTAAAAAGTLGVLHRATPPPSPPTRQRHYIVVRNRGDGGSTTSRDWPASRARLDHACRTIGGAERKNNSGLLPSAAALPLLARGELFQFGVAGGVSLRALLAAYASAQPQRAWGFDTFTGMPHHARGEATLTAWKAGSFKPHAGGKSPADKADSLRRSMMGAQISGGQRYDLRFVVGRFNATLRQSLATESGMGVAALVDIDVRAFYSNQCACAATRSTMRPSNPRGPGPDRVCVTVRSLQQCVASAVLAGAVAHRAHRHGHSI